MTRFVYFENGTVSTGRGEWCQGLARCRAAHAFGWWIAVSGSAVEPGCWKETAFQCFRREEWDFFLEKKYAQFLVSHRSGPGWVCGGDTDYNVLLRFLILFF